MRHPNIPTLAAIRPDLPPALLEAVSQALEPNPDLRTIGAGEFATIVRAQMDIQGGPGELRAILERRRPALERSVRPSGEGDASPQTRNNTQRYEEAALAFDEQPPLDAPTYVAHALPSDVTQDAAGDTATIEPETALPPDLLYGARRSSTRSGISAVGVLLVLFVGLGLLAAGLAVLTR
jgi:hypothetical protein